MTLLQNLFDFERPETTGERIFYRIFEAFMVYWTLYFLWTWGIYITNITDIVLPLGIANYIDITWFFESNRSLWVAGLATVFTTLGFLRIGRFSYLVVLLLFHIQYTARFSLGEISHGSNVIGFAILAMAVGAIAFKQREQMHRFVLGFNYFFLGLGYTSAAVCKLIGTGPTWVDGRHLWLWIGERAVDTFSITGALEFNMLQELTLGWLPLATMILMFGLFTELFGFLMWFKKTRIFIMTLLIGMHFGILFTMKINFPANNVILILLAFPWAGFIDHFLTRFQQPLHERIDRFSVRFA